MTRTRRSSTAARIGALVVLVLALGIGGFAGVQAFTGDDDAGSPSAPEGSGKLFTPPGKRYRFEIPDGVVEVPPQEDDAIPSKIDLSLEPAGKVAQGGVIKTGTLSGPAADGTFDEVGAEAARKYADQYEGHPDQWGQGAAVDRKDVKVGGRDAVEISTRFSPSGNATPSVFFRVLFVDSPSGPPLLVTCDWNSSVTADRGCLRRGGGGVPRDALKCDRRARRGERRPRHGNHPAQIRQSCRWRAAAAPVAWRASPPTTHQERLCPPT